MRVLLRGPFLTNSGYGVHARQFARWALNKADWDVKFQALPWGVTPWIIDSTSEGGLIGRIMERTVAVGPNQPPYDLSIQVQLPNEWDPNLARRNIGVTAAVETDRCNPEWIHACNRMDLVVVPSKFTAQTLRSTGPVAKEIRVIPEAFYDELLDESIGPLDTEISTDFNFLLFGQLTGNNPENDRKNLFYSVKWIFEEFQDQEDVGIILKTNSGKTTKIDRLITKRFVNQLIKETRPGSFPRVHFLHGRMNNAEMVGLMRHPKVKALVSLTRGEGYGLPLLEAAAADLPIVATNWSGHMDFLDADRISAVDYDLVPVHKSRIDNKIFMQGTHWANPREADAKKKLRKVYEKHNRFQTKAKQLGKMIRRDYCFDSISHRLNEMLEAPQLPTVAAPVFIR
jgi:glycosyltransferase involved in cell wall biosynthesis